MTTHFSELGTTLRVPFSKQLRHLCGNMQGTATSVEKILHKIKEVKLNKEKLKTDL